MDLKALQREAHAIAKGHGGWDEERRATPARRGGAVTARDDE